MVEKIICVISNGNHFFEKWRRLPNHTLCVPLFTEKRKEAKQYHLLPDVVFDYLKMQDAGYDVVVRIERE